MNIIEETSFNYFTDLALSQTKEVFGVDITDDNINNVMDIIKDVFFNFESVGSKRLDDIIKSGILTPDEEIEYIDRLIVQSEQDKIDEVIKRVDVMLYGEED
jgi:hypothetical protein